MSDIGAGDNQVIDIATGEPLPPAPPAPPRRRRRWPLALAAVLVVVVLVALAGVVVLRRSNDGPIGRTEAETFLAAWSANDIPRMQSLVSDRNATVAADLEAATKGLQATRASYVLGELRADPEDATRSFAPFTATLTLQGLGDWTYQGELPIGIAESDAPRIVWSRSVIHPALDAGRTLDRTRTRPDRAPILGNDGQPLIGPNSVVTVSIVPQRMTDKAALTGALAANLGIDPGTVDTTLRQPWVKPDQKVPVVTVREDTYQRVRPAIYDIPGLSFDKGVGRTGPADGFGRHVLGQTGEINAEQLAELGPTYQVGDDVGISGIEAAFERQLAGSPSGDVRVLDPTGSPVRTLHHVDGTPPAPVRTTLDLATQQAAETALAGVTQPAAIVAVDGEGRVRAAVSRPLRDGFDRALLGQYPPGSSFKIVTTAALLQSGLPEGADLPCPPTLDVGGKVFRNFEGEAAPSLSFGQAFAHSCNTSFIGAAQDRLSPEQLAAGAEAFGWNLDYGTGLPTKGGSFPPTATPTEEAAAAIGQGAVVASPLHMATVASAAMSGTWRPPVLVDGGSSVPPGAALPKPMDPAVQATLARFMRLVVTEGTGTEAAAAGRAVGGKTGTAEFGAGNPPPTHAWFVGFDGRLATAVVVEGGGVGGEVAAPIASRFFAALP